MSSFHRTTLGMLASAGLLIVCATLGHAETLQTSVPHVILIDAGSGTVLFEQGADDPVDPASTAKIMTAELVFARVKAGTLRLDQMFHISQTAWREGGAPSRGTTMFAKPESDISVGDLLHGLIVDSANDAAIALAEGIAGSQGAFAVLMTRRAKELGFPHLTFTDAWGDANPQQKVTAREMAQLSNYVIATYPDLYKIFGDKDFTWNKIKQPNRNPLLFMDIGADGLRTGNIGDSGYDVVGSAVENGERLTLSLYGAKKASERSEEARKIVQWGFRNFEARNVFAAGDTVGSAEVYGGQSRSVPLTTAAAIRVLVPRSEGEKLNAKIVYTGPLMAPVAADREVAALKIYRGTTEILSTPLRTQAAVPVGPLSKRALDAGLSYVEGLFRKYVLRS